MDKFQNKYRIPSNRKPNWDYSADGMYFLTIVTQNRECNLGIIVETHGRASQTDGRASLQLSDFGAIVETEWYKSFEIRNELILDEFIIMPNHIHTIVVLDNQNRCDDDINQNRCDDDDVETHGRASLQSTTPLQSTTHQSTLLEPSPNIINETIKRNPAIRLPKSISSFIAGFKSAVNSQIDDYIDEKKLNIPKYNRNNHFFQPNYHDHIVRNDWEYHRIKDYIANNPQNWDTDKFNSNK